MISPILFERLPGLKKSLRIALVTESYPPDNSEAARSTARQAEGLRALNHEIHLIRPRQDGADPGAAGREEGADDVRPTGRYAGLNLGFLAKRALLKLWSLRRPDVVYIVTDGPLGWAALQAANKLMIPACTVFRPSPEGFTPKPRLPYGKKIRAGYFRKFHGKAQVTVVTDDNLRLELEIQGLRNLTVIKPVEDVEALTLQLEKVLLSLV